MAVGYVLEKGKWWRTDDVSRLLAAPDDCLLLDVGDPLEARAAIDARRDPLGRVEVISKDRLSSRSDDPLPVSEHPRLAVHRLLCADTLRTDRDALEAELLELMAGGPLAVDEAGLLDILPVQIADRCLNPGSTHHCNRWAVTPTIVARWIQPELGSYNRFFRGVSYGKWLLDEVPASYGRALLAAQARNRRPAGWKPKPRDQRRGTTLAKAKATYMPYDVHRDMWHAGCTLLPKDLAAAMESLWKDTQYADLYRKGPGDLLRQWAMLLRMARLSGCLRRVLKYMRDAEACLAEWRWAPGATRGLVAAMMEYAEARGRSARSIFHADLVKLVEKRTGVAFPEKERSRMK